MRKCVSIADAPSTRQLVAPRGLYQVTSVFCFYGRHINFNFTLLYLLYLSGLDGKISAKAEFLSCYRIFHVINFGTVLRVCSRGRGISKIPAMDKPVERWINQQLYRRQQS